MHRVLWPKHLYFGYVEIALNLGVALGKIKFLQSYILVIEISGQNNQQSEYTKKTNILNLSCRRMGLISAIHYYA